jgi:bacillithiol synthase
MCHPLDARPTVHGGEATFAVLMEPHRLPYERTFRFAPLVLDHLAQDPLVARWSTHPPSREGLLQSAQQRSFDPSSRQVLVKVLRAQYAGLEPVPEVLRSLDELEQEDCLTITTGHQLCLFTGPLYVPLKILNVVRLARELRDARAGGGAVVPVFWMATEDHDRPEIDHAWVNGQLVKWPGSIAGAVGRLPLTGMDAVVQEVGRALGPGTQADELRLLIAHCYSEGRSLADATRRFVHALFGRYGVLCLDADDAALKRLFLPVMREEIEKGSVQHAVEKGNAAMAQRYAVQAHAREVNLFHLLPGARTRITRDPDGFRIGDGASRSLPDLLAELEAHPERFSPNVLMRPLYQECILPNAAYVGGGGELAYWLQLKPLFDHFGIPLPALVLRSSVALMPHKEFVRMVDLGLAVGDLFLPREEICRKVAVEKAGFNTSLEAERERLKELLATISERAEAIDATLGASAAGAASRADKVLVQLEKRFVRVAKAKCDRDLARLDQVLEALFPAGTLQERKVNFMSFATPGLFDTLLKELDPLSPEFTVLVDQPLVQVATT